ncbi:hypothetical protein BUALT_Bualt01G0069800 [Buddleja alternifolia]|uniref:Protein phosphatase inhibitor 2 n=1 Tax=Buddleja alternifolia TaxID=168488 RepID=A0AAV6Y969_9LAMI|nr:hypothetical protein BUALT_Bualt01G0069800 [Buddleja alternifolia]
MNVDSLSPTRGGSFKNGFEDAMHAEAIRSALNDVGSSSKIASRHSGWTTSEDEADVMDQDEEELELTPNRISPVPLICRPIHLSGTDCERRKSFREQRKSHYDEFHKVRELRRNGSFLEEENDEAIHDNGKKSDSSSITAGVKDIDINETSEPSKGS